MEAPAALHVGIAIATCDDAGIGIAA